MTRPSSGHQTLKAIVGLITMTLIGIGVGNAGNAKVEAFVTGNPEEKAKTTLPADTAKVYLIFRTEGIKPGDKVRGILIADHAGHIAPENSKIIEGTMTMDGDTNDGAFKFTKPTDGWPIGEYHVEVYVNDQLATKVKFTIQPAG